MLYVLKTPPEHLVSQNPVGLTQFFLEHVFLLVNNMYKFTSSLYAMDYVDYLIFGVMFILISSKKAPWVIQITAVPYKNESMLCINQTRQFISISWVKIFLEIIELFRPKEGEEIKKRGSSNE